MSEEVVRIVTIVTAVGCAVIGGVFFAFSSFVMRALARVPAPGGIAAMHAINVTVLNPGFLGTFLGTGLACGLLVVAAFSSLARAGGTGWILVGAALYLVGTLGVTFVCNIPRNDALDAVEPNAFDAKSMWARYLREWTFWNHVRTAAAIAAAVCLLLAL